MIVRDEGDAFAGGQRIEGGADEGHWESDLEKRLVRCCYLPTASPSTVSAVAPFESSFQRRHGMVVQKESRDHNREV